jgi:hypothetical protein
MKHPLTADQKIKENQREISIMAIIALIMKRRYIDVEDEIIRESRDR